MGQWVCRCGQTINDHIFPDKNTYHVFSEELWNEISEMADEEGKINWMDIPIPTYDMYRCPNCGRIMLFGEQEDSSFTSYRKESDF